MRSISGYVHICSTLILLAAAFECAGADAQTLVHFDLPAQSLARSLKAIGTKTNTDIGFSASQVAGLTAPPLKADLTVDGALRRVLAGTGLRSQHLNDHTIVVAAAESLASDAAAVKLLPAKVSSAAEADGRIETPQNSSQNDSTDTSTPSSEQQSDQQKDVEEIVVTGTHIRGTVPSTSIITLDRVEIERSGLTELGDVLRTLPQNSAGGNSPQLTPSNAPGANSTFSGGSAPNLRGLGSNATLTLVDGHRLATDTYLGAVDVSLIPLDAVDRVEVVTDGASSIYGSDAVAGVVNVILRKDYEGAKTTGSLGGATDGGALERRVSQLIGTSWQGGGGILAYEHDKLGSVDSTQRDFTSTVIAPYTLLPSFSRDSVYASVHQDFSSSIAANFGGLYTSRDSYYVQTFPPTDAVPVSVKQYLTDGAFIAKLPRHWEASLSASLSDQKSVSTTYSTSPTYIADVHGTSKTIEMTGSGPIIELSNRTVRAALGAGYRAETYDYTAQLLGSPASALVSGERNVKYVFSEMSVPIVEPSARAGLERIDLSLSGRYEHYSDFGNNAAPKVGIAYVPASAWVLRAAWGKSFGAPTLYAVAGQRYVDQFQLSDPMSPSGRSLVLAVGGGNPNLKAETARTWTAGFDFQPEFVERLKLSATYYNIQYSNRLASLPNLFTTLEDPTLAALVTRSPSAALQQSFIANANGGFFNDSPAPYNPATIAAIIDGRDVNLAQQQIEGVDTLVDYRLNISDRSRVQLFANGSYLQLRQRLTPESPEAYLSGTAFYPPKFRSRAGATWTTGSWSATGIANYLGQSTNTFQATRPAVASWATLDAQIVYLSEVARGFFSGFRASLSVQNVLDRRPPYVLFNDFRTGLNFDSVNVTPLGRNITLQLAKSW